MTTEQLTAFIRESNKIEGIKREPTEDEVKALDYFLIDRALNTASMIDLLFVFQPDARLRDKPGMNVRVGNYTPPSGPKVPVILRGLLNMASSHCGRPRHAYLLHHDFESLHPFTDGNGRIGRALWLWMMNGNAPLGFLHTWYYMSLQYGGDR